MSSDSKYSTLLVDDDATSNYLNSIIVIDSHSFNQPIVFSSPQLALDYIEQNWLRANQIPLPELLLIDIHMPGLDGFEFVENLQKMCSDLFNKTLLCFLSSSTNEQDAMRAKMLGVGCYYEKPLKVEHVEKLLTTLKSRFHPTSVATFF